MGQTKGIPQYKKYHYKQSWSSQASTNSYVNLGNSWDTAGLKNKIIQINNTGDTNDIDYKILGSLDNSNFDLLVDTSTIGALDFEIINIDSFLENSYIPYLIIQIKSKVADSHSTVTAIGTSI